MKYLLITFLIFSMSANGQKENSNHAHLKDGKEVPCPNPGHPEYGGHIRAFQNVWNENDTVSKRYPVYELVWQQDSAVIKYKYDTIPVVMLIGDTSKTKYSGFVEIGGWVFDTTWHEPNPSIYWKFGYEVEEYIPERFYSQGFNRSWTGGYWQHLCYLDENKQPMKKSIIVWQTKNR